MACSRSVLKACTFKTAREQSIEKGRAPCVTAFSRWLSKAFYAPAGGFPAEFFAAALSGRLIDMPYDAASRLRALAELEQRANVLTCRTDWKKFLSIRIINYCD